MLVDLFVIPPVLHVVLRHFVVFNNAVSYLSGIDSETIALIRSSD